MARGKKDAWYQNQKIYRDKTGKSGDELGIEFDIPGKYITALKGLEVQFGYGHFWPGKFVETVADNVDANSAIPAYDLANYFMPNMG